MEVTLDSLFEQALVAIDAGDLAEVARLLATHAKLATERLTNPGPWLTDKIGNALQSFMRDPYLLWLLSEDAPRAGTLPANAPEIAKAIVEAAKASDGFQEQLDYAVRLVAWSGVAARSGVQNALLDVLIDAGGSPNVVNDALVNQHVEAARHLIARGGKLTLAAAACLEMWPELDSLSKTANQPKKQMALVLAALNGKAEAVRRLIAAGANPREPSQDLYSHATPLHHAVCSGSLETVRAMLEGGGDVNATDAAWNGTPVGWAEYYIDENAKGEYAAIRDFLSLPL